MKADNKESVIHDWVSNLPFTQQALLMLSLRGPDGLPKHNTAKQIVYYLRGLILKPAYPDFEGKDGFMCTKYGSFTDAAVDFWKDTDAYPMHFLMHIVHAAEVIGYNHPDETIRNHWFTFYANACKNLHMTPETMGELNNRLSY